MNAWILLAIAGLLEGVWAASMKASDGFTHTGPSITPTIAAFASFWLLGLAMRELPLGTAYVVWVAIGAVLVGMVLLQDSATPLRLAGLALVTAGIIALKLA